jgi:serine/threonine-protein kinase
MICPACQGDNRAEAQFCFVCGAPMTELRRGQTVAGRYRILAPLAKGGMGTVFRAEDLVTGEQVALKLLAADWARQKEMARRFEDEMELARKVRHRNVCRVVDCGADGVLRYIATEFIEGTDLKRLLQVNGCLPPAKAFDASIQIARGLQAVHDAGIIHRDVKSPNIMVDRAGRYRLMDFDIAKRASSDTGPGEGGAVLGTPDYMSPEQARGERLDFRSDIYSLGVVLYEIFTGDVPFHGETSRAVILKHLEEAPALEGPVAAKIPAAALPILRKALAKDRVRRYTRARGLVEALRLARATAGIGVV